MLIKKVHQKSVIFAFIIIFEKGCKFPVDIFDGCDDVLMTSVNVNDICHFRHLWCYFVLLI